MPFRSPSRLPATVVLGALAFAAAPPTWAVVVPHATFEEETSATSLGYEHGADPLLPERVSFENRIPSLGSGYGWAATSGGSLPMAAAHADVTSETVFRDMWSGSSASVNYYFYLEQIGGTPVTEQIPIDFVTRGGIVASATEHAWVSDVYAHALVYVDTHDVDIPQGVHSCIPAPCSGTPKSFEYAFTGYAIPEQLVRVSLIASVSGGTSRPGAKFSGDAWVDPVIGISPTYARRDDFRLVFSEGVTAVPEPSTAWLGGIGMLVLGAALGVRRRR